MITLNHHIANIRAVMRPHIDTDLGIRDVIAIDMEPIDALNTKGVIALFRKVEMGKGN